MDKNNDKSTEFFKAKIKSTVQIVADKYYPKYSLFLDEAQRQIAIEVLNSLKCKEYVFYGGYDDASRVILGVYPDILQKNCLDFPVKILRISIPKAYKISHSEILGTLMSLQIKREVIGDILINNNEAYLFVHEDIAQYILDNLFKISNIGVKIDICEKMDEEPIKKYQDVKIVVSSMRIDCIISAITKLSRSKSNDLINAAKVFKNYMAVSSISEIVNPNDIVTVRGFGKFIITDDINETKKGRYYIVLKKFI